METKNIIILLILAIAVIGLAAGAMLLHTDTAKEPTKIKITSDKTQYEGGNLSVKLTDLNNTPLSKQKVNVTIKNSKNKVVVNKTIKTNSKGVAKMDLDLKKGKYTVNVTYDGNENYSSNNTSQNLTIKEEEKVEQTASQTSQSSESNSNYETQQQTDYNSRDSDYYKWDTDGSYHKKQEGAHYVYAQDAVTGEWSYWADKR